MATPYFEVDTLDNDLLHINLPRGKHAFMYGNLKVFDFQEVEKECDDIKWGKTNVTIKEATKIQNLCWLHDMAPRVKRVSKIRFNGKIYFYQEQELITPHRNTDREKEVPVIKQAVEAIGREYGFKFVLTATSHVDCINGKLIDFNDLELTSDYKQKIVEKYRELSCYGKKYYHNVPEWGLTGGPRENDNRIKWLGLDQIDFNRKAVIDLGCAGGFFTRYAKDRGAIEITGYDLGGKGSPDPIKACYLVANDLEYWDIDYINWDLQYTPERNADIVLLLSETFHIGVPNYLPLLLREGGVCIVEDNSKNRDAKEKLEKLFSRVEHKGFTEDRDHSHLPIYWCYK